MFIRFYQSDILVSGFRSFMEVTFKTEKWFLFSFIELR